MVSLLSQGLLLGESPAENAVKARLRVELSMYCPAWVWVCLLSQLSQFARVRLHPLFSLLDEMLREVEVRGGRRQLCPVQSPRLLPLLSDSESILHREPQRVHDHLMQEPFTLTGGAVKSTESKM